MRLNLFLKLFLAILATSILLIVAMGGAIRWSFDRGFVDYRLEREQQRIESLASFLLDEYAQQGNWSFIEGRSRWWRALQATSNEMPGHGNPRGHGQGGMPFIALVDPNDKFIAGSLSRKTSGWIRHELVQDGTTIGALLYNPPPSIELFDSAAEQRFEQQQLQATWSIAGLSVLLAALVSYLLARLLLEPIQRMARATRQVAAGDYSVRIPTHSQDELGQLAQDFNAMAHSLATTEKLRLALVADISHELRTPLAILQGEIEALLDGLRQPTPETLQSLKQEVVQLNQLINDLHMLSLADSGALEFDLQPNTSLRAILQRCHDAYQPRLEAKGLTLNIDVPELPPLQGDSTRLNQLFSNVLENSLRYTHAPGDVHIQAEQQADGLHVFIDDSAPGVASEHLPHLCERLYRVDPSRSRALGGSGLGLALCERIAQAHHGTIQAQHSPLGGVRIHVMLPLRQPS